MTGAIPGVEITKKVEDNKKKDSSNIKVIGKIADVEIPKKEEDKG